MNSLTFIFFALFNIFVYIVSVTASLYNLKFYSKRAKNNEVFFRCLFFLSFVPFVNLGVLLFTLVKVRQIYEITQSELNTLLGNEEEKNQ